MVGLKVTFILAIAHAGHIVFHGPREDVMPFFNSMVRNSLRQFALSWCTQLHWAAVAPRLVTELELGSGCAERLM